MQTMYDCHCLLGGGVVCLLCVPIITWYVLRTYIHIEYPSEKGWPTIQRGCRVKVLDSFLALFPWAVTLPVQESGFILLGGSLFVGVLAAILPARDICIDTLPATQPSGRASFVPLRASLPASGCDLSGAWPRFCLGHRTPTLWLWMTEQHRRAAYSWLGHGEPTDLPCLALERLSSQ